MATMHDASSEPFAGERVPFSAEVPAASRGPVDEKTDEITRLQGCIDDLISVLALPATWRGQDSAQRVETLLDVVIGMLRLDFGYARLEAPGGAPPVEMARVARTDDLTASPRRVGQALDAWLGTDPQQWPLAMRMRSPIGEGDVSIVPLRLGLRDDLGLIVVGSRRADFPRETDRLLLKVAANQAAIALQEARLLGEQERIVMELDRRVAQRTRELAATNEELAREIEDRRKAEEKVRNENLALREEIDRSSMFEETPRREANASAGAGVSLVSRLAHHERELIEAALEASGGRVAGPSGAAIRLGIPRQTLDSKIHTLRINKHRFKPH